MGIEAGGSFDILGSQYVQNSDETISVATAVKVVPEADNSCQMVIFDN